MSDLELKRDVIIFVHASKRTTALEIIELLGAALSQSGELASIIRIVASSDDQPAGHYPDQLIAPA